MGDEGDRTTIPYTQLYRVISGSYYYMRHSASHAGDAPYVGPGNPLSIYSYHPANWRMIQVGTYNRLFKNSSSGQCMAAAFVSYPYTVFNTYTRACNRADSDQWFRVRHFSDGSVQIVHRYDGYDFCLMTYNFSSGTPVDFEYIMSACANDAYHRWCISNER